MRALVVDPSKSGQAGLLDVHEPPSGDGLIQVEAVAVGVCGTDREIVAGEYGWAPPGRDRLVLGHESLSRVHSGTERLRVLPGCSSWRTKWASDR
jgi:threonine dehydrogenase-like Zn-dependent dehydrogenase